MKNKIILSLSAALIVLALFSFKTSGGDGGSKTILVSVLNGKGENEGFMITYDDGKTEKRPFNSKVRAMDVDSWIEVQAQATVLMKELNEKGYRYNGSVLLYGLQPMIFVKN